MPKLSPFSYHEVIEASDLAGCPVCRWANSSVERQLKGLIFDSVNDVETRLGIRDSLGFCRQHAWQLPESGDSAPLGIAFIYRDLLNTVNKSLDKINYSQKRPGFFKANKKNTTLPHAAVKNSSIRSHLNPSQPCPACVRKKEMGDMAIIAVVESLGDQDERMTAALEKSDGLCFSHLRQALDTAPNKTAFVFLVQTHHEKLNALIAELDEFIRKNDYRFQHEGFGAESDSWLRALTLMAGPKP